MLDEPEGAPAAAGETAPPPARHERWRALAEVVLCSGYPTQLALAGLLTLAGLTATDPDGRLSATFVFALSMLDTIVLLGLVVYLIRLGGERPRDLFLGGRRVTREAALGLAITPAILLFVGMLLVLLRTLAPGLQNVPENPFAAFLDDPLGAAAFVAVALIAGGLREELQRAFLLHRFEQHLGGAGVGLLVTSLAFGLGHTLQGWDAAIATGTLGALWGAVYLWRRSVVACVVSHALFNSSELVISALTR